MPWTTFPTPLGTAAVAWRDEALTAVVLPTTEADALSRIRRRSGEAGPVPPPSTVAAAIAAMQAHLAGHLDDLRSITVDFTGVPPFEQRVYALTREIPPGTTRTYGELAALLGDPSLARAVGQAMGRNPVPLVVPCHRVLAAGGALGGFSAPGGTETKRRMLSIERAPAVAQGSLFDG